MWRFIGPKLIFGRGALDHLKTLKGKKAFIVTDKTVRTMGFTEKAVLRLKEAGLEAMIFDEIEPNPSIEKIQNGVQSIRAFRPDWIIGFGGGSSIDAGKAMWVLYERPDLSLYDINPYTKLNLRVKSRFIAIPTTSGAGSDATWAIAVTSTEENRKKILASEEIIPDIAIVDPFFPSTMPSQLTADTGLDSLVHAIEAYVSPWSNVFSDALAMKAIQLIFHYLPRSFKNRDDEEARAQVHYAASMAGMAMGNSQVGVAHSMGHALGAFYGIPHGRAVAIFLPYIIEYNFKEACERYGEIAASIAIGGYEQKTVQKLTEKILKFIKALNEPTSIKELDIDKRNFTSNLENLVNHAFDDPSVLGNPRTPTKKEIERLFTYVWEGKKIDF
jgi:alcohol dehydrogenase class IV